MPHHLDSANRIRCRTPKPNTMGSILLVRHVTETLELKMLRERQKHEEWVTLQGRLGVAMESPGIKGGHSNMHDILLKPVLTRKPHTNRVRQVTLVIATWLRQLVFHLFPQNVIASNKLSSAKCASFRRHTL